LGKHIDEAAEFHGEGEDDGRALVSGNIGTQRSEITQLHRLGAGGKDLRGFQELLRRLLFAFRVDDPGAALALGLGLSGDPILDIDMLPGYPC
jgi:hypothetical protein